MLTICIHVVVRSTFCRKSRTTLVFCDEVLTMPFDRLLVCAGAGGDQAGKSYSDAFLGLDIVSYYWN